MVVLINLCKRYLRGDFLNFEIGKIILKRLLVIIISQLVMNKELYVQ